MGLIMEVVVGREFEYKAFHIQDPTDTAGIRDFLRSIGDMTTKVYKLQDGTASLSGDLHDPDGNGFRLRDWLGGALVCDSVTGWGGGWEIINRDTFKDMAKGNQQMTNEEVTHAEVIVIDKLIKQITDDKPDISTDREAIQWLESLKPVRLRPGQVWLFSDGKLYWIMYRQDNFNPASGGDLVAVSADDDVWYVNPAANEKRIHPVPAKLMFPKFTNNG
jgi:hypothetical protein